MIVLEMPTAIVYLRSDVSGARQQWDEMQARSLGKRLGYTVAKTVVFGEHVEQPIQRLANVVRRMQADAVVVPSLEHLGGTVPDGLLRVVDVITVEPHDTYARWIIPPDAAAEMRARRPQPWFLSRRRAVLTMSVSAASSGCAGSR
ncbi:hypothetical protein [Nocardia seriolae]|uniref:hypothetical protein n=1 Tax=Nocardia seriolae TaxID=37332 RepID=UPI0015E6A3DB|nr:hypothetical protein [Nocardia seriolae]QUN16347.1 hypothetical protein KEC46_29480 [Nocardia seriolae]